MGDFIKRTHELLAFSNPAKKENKAIRIVLVDRREFVRQGLRGMLEPEEDMWVVGDCASVEEALSEIPRLHQDITLMGTQMRGMNMIEATRKLKRNGLNHNSNVIILADSADYRDEVLEAGAASYLLSDITREELTQAIRRVYQNRQSLNECEPFVNETVELVIPPSANAAQLVRFMCQLEEILHDDSTSFANIIYTVGSWNCSTVITLRIRRNAPFSLPIMLTNMPNVEKVEEEPLTKDAPPSFPKKFSFLSKSSISPSKRICVTLKETGMASMNS